MAEKAGMSHTMIGRPFGLKPHVTKSFKMSPDPQFIDKVRDVVGLYMNPPTNAVVFSFDEKSHVSSRRCALGVGAFRPRHSAGPHGGTPPRRGTLSAVTISRAISGSQKDIVMKAIMCIVPTRAKAGAIVQRLTSSMFPAEDISILLPDRKGTRDFAHELGTKAPEGAVTGVAVGGVAGGTLGLLAGLGLLVIPGVGPLLAVGPLFAALSGAAVGATGGGVVGSLVGLGLPEVQAKKYEGKIASGNILISAHCETDEQNKFAKNVFKEAGATDISSLSETSVPAEHSDREVQA
jgi:hypothetical protein